MSSEIPRGNKENNNGRMTRRKFLRDLGLATLGIIFSGIILEILRNILINSAEKRHLKGFWEIFSKKENKEKLENFVKKIYPDKDPKTIIENTYRLILTEQYLLPQSEKNLEVLGFGASKGLGQITERTFQSFFKHIEEIEPQIKSFLREIYNREIELSEYPENPVVNFIIVLLYFEFLRKRGEKLLTETKKERAKKLVEEISESDSYFRIEKDIHSRKKTVENSFLKLDELYALCSYSTRETSPISAWVQSIINIIKILKDDNQLIAVDGDLGEITLEELKKIGIETLEIKINEQKQVIRIEDFKKYKSIENIILLQDQVKEIFREKYLSEIKSLINRILNPSFSIENEEDKKAVNRLFKLIKSSYQLQIGFHSLVDEYLKVESVSISYWETEVKRANFLQDEFHNQWLAYLKDKNKQQVFDYLPPSTNKNEFIRHLARVFIIRFSILFESGIEIPEQIIDRVGIYSTQGERFPK